MPRHRSFHGAQQSDEINISPLIDMVFILLIFFIVTTVFVDERGFEASKPDNSPQDKESEIEPVIFRVTENGEVLHGGEKIGISGVRRAVLNEVSSQGEDLPVIIQVEQGSRADVALRVFDEALVAGATAVNLAEAK